MLAYRLTALSQYRSAIYYVADELSGGERLRTHLESNDEARYVDCDVLDFEMRVDLLDEGISRDLLVYGVREPLATTRYREELARLEADRGGLTVVDIGGNVGYFVLAHLAQSDADGEVIAIEPNPESYALLQQNVRLNGFEESVECYPYAIGEESRQTIMQVSTHSNLATVGETTQGSHYVDEIDVPMTSLDEFLVENDVPFGSVDVLRMDLQGYEYEVFRGMSTLLEKGDVGLMFLEIHPWYLKENGEYEEFLSLLEAAGFELTFAADGRTVVLRKDKPTYAERELDVASIDGLRDVDFTTEVILRRR